MTVIYDPESHLSVFFSLHGSVWPNVLGWCILNTAVMYTVWILKHKFDWDVTFANTGHDLLSLLISFLIVNHVSTSYARFWEARDYLGRVFGTCRKISQKVSVYTMDIDPHLAQPYRDSVKGWLIELLRNSMEVIEDEKQSLFYTEGRCIESMNATRTLDKRLLGSLSSFRCQQDPMEAAGMLQAAIMTHESALKTDKLIRFELELSGLVNSFIDSYMQLVKFPCTPIPFPLVQMGRTLLYVWIFSLPGVLAYNIQDMVANLILIFFITYGFLGLMYVSIELHDPFGKDANDFEISRYVKVVCLGIEEDLSAQGAHRFSQAQRRPSSPTIKSPNATYRSVAESEDHFP